MWTTINKLVQNYLNEKTATMKFGQRIAIFSLAVALREGLFRVADSIDKLASANRGRH